MLIKISLKTSNGLVIFERRMNYVNTIYKFGKAYSKLKVLINKSTYGNGCKF